MFCEELAQELGVEGEGFSQTSSIVVKWVDGFYLFLSGLQLLISSEEQKRGSPYLDCLLAAFLSLVWCLRSSSLVWSVLVKPPVTGSLLKVKFTTQVLLWGNARLILLCMVLLLFVHWFLLSPDFFFLQNQTLLPSSTKHIL